MHVFLSASSCITIGICRRNAINEIRGWKIRVLGQDYIQDKFLDALMSEGYYFVCVLISGFPCAGDNVQRS